MSFASVGSLGTASTKSTVATLSMNPTSNVAAGHLVVVVCAVNESHISGGNLATDDWTGCTDSQGNLYTQLIGLQGQQGTSQTAGYIYVSVLETALSTTDTITLTENSGSPHTPKSMSAWEFTIGTSKWALYDRNGSRTAAGTAVPSISITPGVSQEYLVVRVLDSEGPNTDTFTEDANFTSFTLSGTSGGTTASNETVFAGFRIATATTFTAAVSQSPTRNIGQGIVAIAEYTDPIAFPYNPVLDDFNRADESPISDSGAWITTTPYPSETATNNHLALVSNQATAQSATTTYDGQWWATTFASARQEAFATIATVPSTAGDEVGVLVASTTGGASTFLGAQAKWRWKPHGVGLDALLLAWTGNLGGQTNAMTWVNMSSGAQVGCRHLNDFVTQTYVNLGLGWRWCAGFYSTSVQNGTINSHVGLQCRRTVARLDDFGGGEVPVSVAVNHFLPILGVGA